MQWILSTILGLIIAWVILAFIGPGPAVSYYVQQPVVPTLLSELDKIMEAVGLRPSSLPAPSPAAVEIMSSPAPVPSVADVAMAQENVAVSDEQAPSPGSAPAVDMATLS